MDQTTIIQLLEQITPICIKAKQAHEERRKRGEFFNVFKILRLESEEVRLHSAFLAELLNPNGNHGMGDAFLRQFILMLDKKGDFIDSTRVNPSIVERGIGYKTEEEGGRLDIIIEDGSNAVIIENKIYATDQNNQLLRYENYGKKFRRHILVYLTLDGREASDDSTGRQDFKYICLSYRKDIITWLYECAKLAYDIPHVRETIKQYIQLLRELTNQNMENADTKKIAELAVDNIEAAAALMDSCEEVGKILRERYIFKPIKEYAEKHDLKCDISENECFISLKKEDWEGEINIRPEMQICCWKEMYIGITKACKETAKLDCLSEAPVRDWPFGWEYLEPKNWQDAKNYPALKSEARKSLEAKIEKILKEIEEKQITI